ncbi:MAG: restriction endonuclease [Methanobacterium formicicum]
MSFDFKTINGLTAFFKDLTDNYDNASYLQLMERLIFSNGDDLHSTLLSITDEYEFDLVWSQINQFLNLVNFKDFFFMQSIIHTLTEARYGLQVKLNKPLPKGLWLHVEGLFFYLKGNKEEEVRYITLALIEDIIHMDLGVRDAIRSDAFRHLATHVYGEQIAINIVIEIEKRIKHLEKEIGDIYYPEDVLNLDEQIDIIPGEAHKLFNLNSIHYHELFETFINTEDDKKGKTLENLIKVAFSSVIGLQFMKQNLYTKSPELDLIYRVLKSDNPFYEMFGQYLIIECKAWDNAVGVKEIRSLVGNLQSLNVKGGILIAKKGISGQNQNQKLYSELEITKAYHRHGITIAILNEDDLLNIDKGSNLIAMLLKSYENTRFDLR